MEKQLQKFLVLRRIKDILFNYGQPCAVQRPYPQTRRRQGDTAEIRFRDKMSTQY